MTAPTLAGIHHLKLPVTDLDTSLAWYERVFGARHLEQFDHFDRDHRRFAAILAIPGVDTTLELRWAPLAAEAIGHFDPVSFAVGGEDDLHAWSDHLDEVGAEHSPIERGGAGLLLAVADPDGTFLRLLTLPEGGVEAIEMTGEMPEPEGPWIAPAIMRHPGEDGYDAALGGAA